MDKLCIDDKTQMKDQNETQVRNPNFRRHQGLLVPQVILRGQRNPNEQQIRPLFQENLVDEGYIEKPQDHIHHFGNNEPRESRTFLTKDEHDSFVSQEEEEDDEYLVEEESEDYQKDYLNAMMDFQKQYNLTSINLVVDPPKKALEGQALASHLTRNLPKREVVQQKPIEKYIPKARPSKEKSIPKYNPSKEKSLPKESIPKEKDLQQEEVKKDLITVERHAPPFSLQNETSKINISVPFNEILINLEYKGLFSKMKKCEESFDSLNL